MYFPTIYLIIVPMCRETPIPYWDAIIVGGGSAGLSAALMLGRAQRRALVVDAGKPRNRFADHMHGMLGHEGTPPADFLALGRSEVERYGIQFENGIVESVREAPLGLDIRLVGEHCLTARTLIVATGVTDILPQIPGLQERWGTSVLHCPYCHGLEVANRELGVLAHSSAALHQVQMVRQWSDRVKLFFTEPHNLAPEIRNRLESRQIEIIDSPAVEILGDGMAIDAVRTADGRDIAADAIFTLSSLAPRDDFLSSLNLERTNLPFTEDSFLAADQSGRTSHQRIWAAGNVVNPMANVPMAIGAGAFTGAAVNGFLVEEDFDMAMEVAHG